MYKILVTTKYSCMSGVSLHTVIVEFSSNVDAVKARDIINNYKDKKNVDQWAICLF